MTQELSQKLSEDICSVWNQLAKKHGWRQQKNADQVLRTPQLITTTLKILAENQKELCQNSIEIQDLSQKQYIQEIFEKWNWEKSPAPLRLITSPTQWKTLTYQLQKTHEEHIALEEESLQRLFALVQREWNLQRTSLKTPEQARKTTEEYLQASGKWGSLTSHQKLRLCELLDQLAPPHG